MKVTPKQEQILVTLRDCFDNDIKTSSARPQEWPMLEKGTEVRFVKLWSNCYGWQMRVVGPNGKQYDLNPNSLGDVEDE